MIEQDRQHLGSGSGIAYLRQRDAEHATARQGQIEYRFCASDVASLGARDDGSQNRLALAQDHGANFFGRRARGRVARSP